MSHPRHWNRFSPETFIRAWKSCESKRQLARRLGIHENTVAYWVEKLRKQGVELPPMEVSP